MSHPDYAKTTNERLWVKAETTFNTLIHPVAADALIPLSGVSLPPALSELTPSDERTGHPSVATLIKRKKRPGEWSIPTYAKFPTAKGTAGSLAVLLQSVFGTQTLTPSVNATYALATNIEEESFSLWHWVDNLLRGFRGCLCSQVTLELSGTEEGKLTFEGFAANEVFAGVTTLAAAVAATPATGEITLTVQAGAARRFQVGPATTDTIKLKINSEIFLLKSVNYATDVLTVDRAQDSTVAAAHAIGDEVAPSIPATSPPTEAIAPVTLGTIDLGTLTGIRGLSFTQVVNNQIEARLDEYAQATLTGYRRTGRREVTGTLRAYARQTVQALLSDIERELVEDAVIRAGATTTARLTVNMDRLRLLTPALDGGGAEFIFEFGYQALGTAAGNDETTWVVD